MRLSPGFSLALVLALLLVGTTPTGTGVGLHQFDLVHPLFTHVHIVNGQVVAHDQLQQASPARSTAGPSFGAGSGANPALAGLGIGPFLPTQTLGPVTEPIWPRLNVTLPVPVGRLQDTPPDPPPTSAS